MIMTRITLRRPPILTAALLGAFVLTGAGATWALDTQLAGIQVGTTPAQVTKLLGSPLGILARRSDGTVEYYGTGALGRTAQYAGGPIGDRVQPSYTGPGQVMTGSTANLGLPPTADIVRVARLGRSQVEWMYLQGDPQRNPLSIGVVITGQGPDAVISDVIVASLASSPRVVTEKGIRLGDDFAAVIGRYGFPTEGLTPFQARPAPTATSTAYATPAGAGATAPAMPPSAYSAGTAGAGGALVGVVGESLVVNLDDRATLFTKCCIANYGEIDFTFCDMKVVRIHIAD
jgi:hypothetical protein